MGHRGSRVADGSPAEDIPVGEILLPSRPPGDGTMNLALLLTLHRCFVSRISSPHCDHALSSESRQAREKPSEVPFSAYVQLGSAQVLPDNSTERELGEW